MATDRVSSRAVTPITPTFTSPLRHYTGVWCLFVAALPIVVTQFGLIPVYESQRSLLPAYASFFCLLALAFVFSQRHRMARTMFAPRLLWPDESSTTQVKGKKSLSINAALAAMIFGALACTAIYLWAFEIGRTSPTFPRLPPTSLNAVLLALSFITLFLLASAAFAVVAVREHIQRVLGLSDAEVITGLPRPPQPAAAAVAHHAAISVVAERPPSRMSGLSLGEEAFAGEELFKREPTPPLRAGGGKGEPAGRA
jgi:hypothetical protein